jgi:hypothetical protein
MVVSENADIIGENHEHQGYELYFVPEYLTSNWLRVGGRSAREVEGPILVGEISVVAIVNNERCSVNIIGSADTSLNSAVED